MGVDTSSSFYPTVPSDTSIFSAVINTTAPLQSKSRTRDSLPAPTSHAWIVSLVGLVPITTAFLHFAKYGTAQSSEGSQAPNRQDGFMGRVRRQATVAVGQYYGGRSTGPLQIVREDLDEWRRRPLRVQQPRVVTVVRKSCGCLVMMRSKDSCSD